MTGIVASGWLLVAIIFGILWWHALRTQNAGWVDFGWSATLVLLVGWYALWVDGLVWRKAFYFAVVALWGGRLAGYLWRRLRREGKEDGRYAQIRQHWGASANRKFFWFFQAQGVANLLLTAPVLLLMGVERESGSIWDVLGLVVMAGAVWGESLADRQLARWKAKPGHRGRTCRHGLWRYSRHPNYFFEWLYWVGWPILGLALLGTPLAVWWPLTLLGPVVMLVLLLQFTGIPYTEQQALKSRGEDYRVYQREVSPFIPWKPKTKKDDERD